MQNDKTPILAALFGASVHIPTAEEAQLLYDAIWR